MVSTRNRILNLVDYIESTGIVVNIGKNKARGNKGFFKAVGDKYRIDISSKLDDETVLRILIHEFAHFIHYQNDKTLKNLDFIFDDVSDDLLDEMIMLTVESIPKETVSPLFEEKDNLKSKIKKSSSLIKQTYQNFNISKPFEILEKRIKKTPYKYLLKHDIVKLVDFFSTKILSINDLDKERFSLDDESIEYIRLKSLQRKLNKLNNRISKLNKYYNSTTELFARSIEFYILETPVVSAKTPLLKAKLDEILRTNKIPHLTNLVNICNISI